MSVESASPPGGLDHHAGFDGRGGAGAVWAGDRLLIGGGSVDGTEGAVAPRSGLAFSPSRGWSTLPVSPLRGRTSAVMVWTGRALLVWGGDAVSTGAPLRDGAVLAR